jgi:hypothetical protein
METKINPLLEDLLKKYRDQANIQIEPVFARGVNVYFNGYTSFSVPGVFKPYIRKIRLNTEDNDKFSIGDYVVKPEINGLILPFTVCVISFSEHLISEIKTQTLTLDFHT